MKKPRKPVEIEIADRIAEEKKKVTDQYGIDPEALSNEEIEYFLEEDLESFSREDLLKTCNALRAIALHSMIDLGSCMAMIEFTEELIEEELMMEDLPFDVDPFTGEFIYEGRRYTPTDMNIDQLAEYMVQMGPDMINTELLPDGVKPPVKKKSTKKKKKKTAARRK